ncbi:hypothetical protein ADH76_35095 [Enterocloster clostridioformis]|nr:hypothetical protein A4V08_07075 [Lachnoclostridium sp. YL32]OXE61669.1 hypothetical protein ADH76_35095 [Enterocloster clostridioformis]
MTRRGYEHWWLDIYWGTNIDYPVMKTTWESEYYFHQNFVVLGVWRGDMILYKHNIKKRNDVCFLTQIPGKAIFRKSFDSSSEYMQGAAGV